MEFKQTTIAPAGRNKYGNYLSSSNVTKSVVMTTYAGNDTTTTIGDTGGQEDSGVTDFYCMLSQTNATFNAVDLSQGASASTQIIAYRGYQKGVTYVCDMDAVSATTEDETITELIAPEFMGIRNVPCGITVTFTNNGTSASTIIFTADTNLTGNSGAMYIPVCVYKRSDDVPLPDDLYNWYEHKDDCEIVWLEYVWNVNRSATGNYTMDLSNQTAGVNCDSAGTLYPNSIATLQCTAITYYNGAPDTEVTYSLSIQAKYLATGVSINANTGVLTFNSGGTVFSWSTAYPALPIDIIASKQGSPIASKTMTITRNYPGTDGTPAHTRWINTSANIVTFDPTTSAFTPSSVVGTVWLQVGNELPVEDSSTTIYQWYNNMETGKTSATGSITANTYLGVDLITFGLKNGANQYYELEDVPVIPKGTEGPAGPSGATGPSGESAWYLTTNNDNASINCDASGNILSNAVRPTCQAKLYYGGLRKSDATYQISYTGATGVTSAVSNGILTIYTSASTFNFDGPTLQISISGISGGQVKDVKTFNITKAYAGENGDDAVSYWLEVSFGEIIFDPNTKSVSPTAITATGYKQIGQGAVIPAADATIKYKWQSRSTGAFTTETAYTSQITITSANCNTYSRLRLTMYVGQNQVDMEDIDIMKNGLDGTAAEGRRGPAIRGPYNWYDVSASTRCWCAGESSTTCDDCDKWIDVILKDDVYYYCNTTYNGGVYPWSTYQSYWTSGDSFDFIATNLLLAQNAKIYFLTNNELYLTDENGNITGGARGGSGTTFWAGSEAPGDAPFRVDTDGNIYAQKGVFAGYVQYPYTFVSDLMPDLQVSASSVSARYLHDTNWKGRLETAPTNPSNGWCYANTTDHKIYYYLTNRWVQVYETGNQVGYMADGHAYLVSDGYNVSWGLGVPSDFYLPAPSSAWNGFTYEIIVEPRISRMDGPSLLHTMAMDGSDIFCYAFAELRSSSAFTLENGKFTITCMPRHGNSQVIYRWAITTATGSLTCHGDSTDEYISTLLATSNEASPLYKVITYTGSTKPSVFNSSQTMFVQK